MIFITHAKAGSTWVDNILRTLYRKQVAPRLFSVPQTFSFEKHRIYSAVFMSRAEYLTHPELFGVHAFVTIRDLRDTMISQYFSTRNTHGDDPGGKIAERRQILHDLSQEDGMLYLIDNVIEKHATIQESWLGSGVPYFRYEELLQRDVQLFEDLLLRRFGHAASAETIAKAVQANRFESVFGRKLGVSDATSHGRTGLPGDWKNHFTPRIAARFREKFGNLLISTGYEPNHQWAEHASGSVVG
jgi:lipopolysaccharide transport system ATP-binding protein